MIGMHVMKRWTNCANKEVNQLEPFLYEDAPMGKVVDVKTMVSKLEFSEGCGEVIAMSESGGCREHTKANKVWTAYGHNVQFSMSLALPSNPNRAPYMDVCKLKIHAKESL